MSGQMKVTVKLFLDISALGATLIWFRAIVVQIQNGIFLPGPGFAVQQATKSDLICACCFGAILTVASSMAIVFDLRALRKMRK
jgi:hypothetical protein